MFVFVLVIALSPLTLAFDLQDVVNLNSQTFNLFSNNSKSIGDYAIVVGVDVHFYIRLKACYKLRDASMKYSNTIANSFMC